MRRKKVLKNLCLVAGITLGCGPASTTPVAPVPTPASSNAASQPPRVGRACPPEGDGGPSRDCLALCIERGLTKAGLSVTTPFVHHRLRGGVLASEMDATVNGEIWARFSTGLAESNEITQAMEDLPPPPGTAFFHTCPNPSATFVDPMTSVRKLFVLSISAAQASSQPIADRVCGAYKAVRLDRCENTDKP